MKYVIITQVKNQEYRIYDWMKYHHSEGFDSFVIFDDYSDDDTVNEIERAANDFNMNVILNKTDGIGMNHIIDECRNSDSYALDISLHNRLERSYAEGNKIVKSINPDAICAVIDVDEFLATDEDKSIVAVIEELMRGDYNMLFKKYENKSFNFGYLETYKSESNQVEEEKPLVIEQLLVPNFDIEYDYLLEKGFLFKNKFKKWDYQGVENDETWKLRCKSIVISKYVDKVNFVHYLINPPSVKNTIFNKDYSKLRMYHFRTPNQNANIKFVEDDMLDKMIDKIKNIKKI